MNTYGYVGGNPVTGIDIFGLAKYVVVVGDPGLGSHNAGTYFDRVADTRAYELRDQGHNVDVVRVSNVADFNNAMNNGATVDGGVIYVGHGWNGRLYIGENAGAGTNLDASNIDQLSGANLGPDASVELLSCNAGSPGYGGGPSIAELIANQTLNPTTGYNRPLGFTGTPGRYMHGVDARPPSTGPIYMVPTPGGSAITTNPQR